MINQFLKNIIKKKKTGPFFSFSTLYPEIHFVAKIIYGKKTERIKRTGPQFLFFLEFLFGHVTGACDVGGSEAAGSGEHMGRFGGPHGAALGPGPTHVAWRWKVLLRL